MKWQNQTGYEERDAQLLKHDAEQDLEQMRERSQGDYLKRQVEPLSRQAAEQPAKYPVGRLQKEPGVHPARYERNVGTVSRQEQELLRKKSICIVGCGGLGGGVIEGLTRLGVGKLTIVDGDVFDDSNLNRQVLSNEENIGKEKAAEGARQMKQINSEVQIRPLHMMLDAQNSRDIIRGHDVVVDALDNVQSRLVLEDACEKEGIPLVHGAIAGWNGQVAVVRPKDRLLHAIYQGGANKGAEVETGNPSFTPAVVSAMQVAETLKLLLGRDGVLENKLLLIDLLHHEYEMIEFG